MAELVRHFLIEPTSKGVRLKGCTNEPVFGECLYLLVALSAGHGILFQCSLHIFFLRVSTITI